MGETAEKVKHLWETWDIRALVLTSLSIQILLTLLAPLRKRYASGALRLFMWILYLSADAVALYTIGLISSTIDDEAHNTKAVHHVELLAFWAPFLLLHLGGPDTITALALEDNELWRRHALQFATQVAVTIYAFSRSFNQSKGLLGPTLLMLFDGCIKYCERTFALYYASVKNFRLSHKMKPEPGPNYARLMEEYSSAASGFIPAKIFGRDTPLGGSSDSSEGPDHKNNTLKQSCRSEKAADHWYQVKETDEMIKEAYSNYDKFKGLLADAFLSLKDRDESRCVFLSKPAREAFRIVEIELNFVYEVFYTKAYLLQKKRGFVRLISFISLIASLVWFSIKDKSKYGPIDVRITFILLGGAMALDATAYIMFLFSDWVIVFPSMNIGRQKFAEWLLSCSKWATYPLRGRRPDNRWSQSIATYSLLEQSLKDPISFRLEQYIPILRGIKEVLQDAMIGWFYVPQRPLDEQIGNFIFDELWKKAEVTDEKSIKEVCGARGNLVTQEDYLLVSEYLRSWTLDIDYDESLLAWHLATDLCYWTTTATDRGCDQYRKISKDLSDYMSYLFLRQQKLVNPVVGSTDIRCQDTCEEARKFLHERLDSWSDEVWIEIKKFLVMINKYLSKILENKYLSKILKLKNNKPSEEHETSPPGNNDSKQKRRSKTLVQCCNKILKVKADIKPLVAKGDKSKSVLFDACRLAKQLKMFGDNQWIITAKVWVELLSYAAVRCPPRSHVAELNRGGELITLVWLLMAHLGLGERFRQNRGFGWTKLVIPK